MLPNQAKAVYMYIKCARKSKVATQERKVAQQTGAVLPTKKQSRINLDLASFKRTGGKQKYQSTPGFAIPGKSLGDRRIGIP